MTASSEVARVSRLALAGAAMLVLSYPLTFTIRAHAISGRDTRVHLSGVVGAALLWACMWYLALALSRRRLIRQAIVTLLSAILALLLGFGIVIQKDYELSWRLQQRLWTSLIRLVPDLEPDTVILVDPSGLTDARYIDANTWSLPTILQYVYQFPESWTSGPRVHRLLPDWRDRALWNSTEIKAVDFKWEYVIVPWQDVVILETAGNEAVRRLDEVELGGETYRLRKASGDKRPSFGQGFLYGELIAEGE
jgi:hypothetical protein